MSKRAAEDEELETGKRTVRCACGAMDRVESRSAVRSRLLASACLPLASAGSVPFQP